MKTPRNTEFSNSKVHSIYKKGKIRDERVNREDIVEVSNPTIQEIWISNHYISIYINWITIWKLIFLKNYPLKKNLSCGLTLKIQLMVPLFYLDR